MAFPLIAGPATLTAVVLLMGQTEGQRLEVAVGIGCMLACLAITFLCLLATEVLHRLMKTTGVNVVVRLFAMILAALAMQFILDGLRSAHQSR